MAVAEGKRGAKGGGSGDTEEGAVGLCESHAEQWQEEVAGLWTGSWLWGAEDECP